MSSRSDNGRRDAVGAYYAAQARWLERVVARRAKVPHATVQEACQTAWLTLVRRPDITLDGRGLRWLVVVATHEAWRSGMTPERPAGTFIGTTSDVALEWHEPPGPASDPLELAIAHELHDRRVEQLTDAKPREATVLFLQAAGYSYTELQQFTGGTYTAVNRRLTEGRGRIGAGGRATSRRGCGNE
jgi:DNA-directed RNA polymerase specialized sigma24 family protein